MSESIIGFAWNFVYIDKIYVTENSWNNMKICRSIEVCADYKNISIVTVIIIHNINDAVLTDVANNNVGIL